VTPDFKTKELAQPESILISAMFFRQRGCYAPRLSVIKCVSLVFTRVRYCDAERANAGFCYAFLVR